MAWVMLAEVLKITGPDRLEAAAAGIIPMQAPAADIGGMVVILSFLLGSGITNDNLSLPQYFGSGGGGGGSQGGVGGSGGGLISIFTDRNNYH